MNIKKLNIFSQKPLSKAAFGSKNNFSNLKLKTLNQDSLNLGNLNFGAKFNETTNEATFKLGELKEIFGKKALVKAKNKFNLPIQLEDFDIDIRKDRASGKKIISGDMNFVKYVNKYGCDFTSDDINKFLENVETIEGELVIGGFNDIYLPDLKKVNKLSAKECDNLNLCNLQTAQKTDISRASNVNLSSLEYSGSLEMPNCKNIEFPSLEAAGKIYMPESKRVFFPKLEKIGKLNADFAEDISMPELTYVSNADLYETVNFDAKNLKRVGKIYAQYSINLNISSLEKFEKLNLEHIKQLQIPPKTKRAYWRSVVVDLMSTD